MNHILFAISCAFLGLSSCLLFSTEPTAPAQTSSAQQIHWYTNYDQAMQESKATSKPLVLFFTGSDWCGWCNKLEDEALDTSAFAAVAGDKFVFLKLDYPLYVTQDASIKAQNQSLQQKYNVRSFPTVIILDTKQNRQLGTTGYVPGGGKVYAEHLLQYTK